MIFSKPTVLLLVGTFTFMASFSVEGHPEYDEQRDNRILKPKKGKRTKSPTTRVPKTSKSIKKKKEKSMEPTVKPTTQNPTRSPIPAPTNAPTDAEEKKELKLAYISSKYSPDVPPDDNAVAVWGYNDEYMFDFAMSMANEQSWCGEDVTLKSVKFQANGTADMALDDFVESQLNDENPPEVFLGADWGPVTDAVIKDTTKNLIGAGTTGSGYENDPSFFRTCYSDGDAIKMLIDLMLGRLANITAKDNLYVRTLYLSDDSFGVSGYNTVENYIQSGSVGAIAFPELVASPPTVTTTASSFSSTEDVDEVANTVTTLMEGTDPSNTVIFISASGPQTAIAFSALEKAGYSAQYALLNTPSNSPWIIGATEGPDSTISTNGKTSPERLQAAAGYLYYESPASLVTMNCSSSLQNQYVALKEKARNDFPPNEYSPDPLTGGFSYYSYDLVKIFCKAIRYREEIGSDLSLGDVVRLEDFPGIQGTSGVFLKYQTNKTSPDNSASKQMFKKLISKGGYNSNSTDYDEPLLINKDQFTCPFKEDFFLSS